MASNNLAQATRKSMAMGPSVRNLLMHYNLDPTQIAGTGPRQIILKSDVLSYINQHHLSPAETNLPSTNAHSQASKSTQQPEKAFVPNLNISGYQPKPGPEGFSKIAKKLLEI